MKLISLCLFLTACAVTFGAEAGKKPLKVFILAGQSNATGMVKTNTFEHIKMFPETAKEYADLFDKDGNPVVLDDVYVSQWQGKDSGKLAPRYGGGTKGDMFGPEYAFGIYMHKKLKEPFLIIKTGRGGQSLNFDFRPPSAGEWTPPAGHPDLIKKTDGPATAMIPIPETLDLAADWTPEKPYALQKKHMGLKGFKGGEIGEMNGVYPIYIMYDLKDKIKGNPFQKGDLILGVDGSGFAENPIQQWRDAFYSSKSTNGDWMINITRWRKGKIETFNFDICDTIEGGRAKLPEYLAQQKKEKMETADAGQGLMYRDMIDHTKKVLSDIKSVYPAYDEKAGYELSGFIWFQGWNDMISGVYPNSDKPRGYEQYTWLLEHLIRDVRKELNAPDMPVVIGVMGIGGVQTEGKMGHFQQAQAAVADKPEFKGRVVAVQTGKYWDHDLAALVEKSSQISKKVNDFKYKDGLEGDALKKAYEEYRAKNITPEEEELLKKGVSNAGFHYLGSAKIMCGIGKGFAEAMIKLEERK
jgi:hypothetical protein